MPLSILKPVTSRVQPLVGQVTAPVTAALPAPVQDLLKPVTSVARAEVGIAREAVQTSGVPTLARDQVAANKPTVVNNVALAENAAGGALGTATAVAGGVAQPATSVARPIVDRQRAIVEPLAPEPVAGLLGMLDLEALSVSLDGAVSEILNDPAAFIETLLEGLNLEAISALDLMMLSNLLEGLQTQLEGLLGGAEGLPVDPEQLTSVTEDLGMLSDIFADLTDPFGELPMLDGLVPAPDGALPVLPELPAAGGDLPQVTELTSEDIDNPGGNQTAPSVAFLNSLNNQSPDAFAMRVANATARNNTGTELSDIDPATGEVPQDNNQTAPAADLINATLGSLTGGEDSPLAPVTDLVGLLSMSLPLGALAGAM